MIFSSIATGAIVVTLVGVLSSLTVRPALLALLAKLGERAERRAVRKEARAAESGRTVRPKKQPKTIATSTAHRILARHHLFPRAEATAEEIAADRWRWRIRTWSTYSYRRAPDTCAVSLRS